MGNGNPGNPLESHQLDPVIPQGSLLPTAAALLGLLTAVMMKALQNSGGSQTTVAYINVESLKDVYRERFLKQSRVFMFFPSMYESQSKDLYIGCRRSF